ncbi:MAG: cytochrome c biogenesis protein CcdA [Pseudomonadota bacterium]
MFGIDIIDSGLLAGMAFALLGGFLSFMSPCVLPVALPYLAYMGGVSVRDMNEDRAARRRALMTALFFVLGLSTVFLILGFAFSALGLMFLEYQNYFITGAGILVIAFGLHFIGVYRIKFLDQEARIDAGDKGGTAFGAYILGLAFAFGWTPCLGPILGGILTLAASEADVSRGTFLLGVYAAGLGLPFLLLAAYLPRLSGLMAWLKRNLHAVERTSGVMLVLIGVLLVTGQFTVMANWLLTTFPALGMIG